MIIYTDYGTLYRSYRRTYLINVYKIYDGKSLFFCSCLRFKRTHSTLIHLPFNIHIHVVLPFSPRPWMRTTQGCFQFLMLWLPYSNLKFCTHRYIGFLCKRKWQWRMWEFKRMNEKVNDVEGEKDREIVCE